MVHALPGELLGRISNSFIQSLINRTKIIQTTHNKKCIRKGMSAIMLDILHCNKRVDCFIASYSVVMKHTKEKLCRNNIFGLGANDLMILLLSHNLMKEIYSIKGKGVCSCAADGEEESKLFKQKGFFSRQKSHNCMTLLILHNIMSYDETKI